MFFENFPTSIRRLNSEGSSGGNHLARASPRLVSKWVICSFIAGRTPFPVWKCRVAFHGPQMSLLVETAILNVMVEKAEGGPWRTLAHLRLSHILHSSSEAITSLPSCVAFNLSLFIFYNILFLSHCLVTTTFWVKGIMGDARWGRYKQSIKGSLVSLQVSKGHSGRSNVWACHEWHLLSGLVSSGEYRSLDRKKDNSAGRVLFFS